MIPCYGSLHGSFTIIGKGRLIKKKILVTVHVRFCQKVPCAYTILYTIPFMALSWFFHGSVMIPECPDLALVLYMNEQIAEMINGLRGNEWDEVLKLEVLPPLPVNPEQKKQAQEQALKDTSLEDIDTEKRKRRG